MQVATYNNMHSVVQLTYVEDCLKDADLLAQALEVDGRLLIASLALLLLYNNI